MISHIFIQYIPSCLRIAASSVPLFGADAVGLLVTRVSCESVALITLQRGISNFPPAAFFGWRRMRDSSSSGENNLQMI